MKRQLLLLSCLLLWACTATAQTFTEIGNKYPVSADGNKRVVSGFIPFSRLSDEKIFANALLWTIENVCPKLREGITAVNVDAKSFACNLVLTSGEPGEKPGSIYYARATFRVADGKLIYYLSDISIESSVFMLKKVTPLEKLSPEKKTSHRETVDAFVQTESEMLNKLFDYVATHKLAPITHWSDINIRRAVTGMNEDECRLAFGKPQSVLETNGETQWMYSSSFYLFFKNGIVQTVIK